MKYSRLEVRMHVVCKFIIYVWCIELTDCQHYHLQLVLASFYHVILLNIKMFFASCIVITTFLVLIPG